MGYSEDAGKERGITKDNSKRMKTKEAIEFDDIDAQKFLYYVSRKDLKNKEKYNAVSKLIILLLNEKSQREKRGEKYEAIVKEISEILPKPHYVYKNSRGKEFTYHCNANAVEIINDIKQKYFPKEK